MGFLDYNAKIILAHELYFSWMENKNLVKFSILLLIWSFSLSVSFSDHHHDPDKQSDTSSFLSHNAAKTIQH